MSKLVDIHNVSKGNMGAWTICHALAEYVGDLATIDFELLIKQGIVGSEVWVLFKNGCNEDITQFHACLMDGSAITRLQACRDSRFYVEPQKERA